MLGWLQPEVVTAIEAVDTALAQLLEGLYDRQILDSIDIILVYTGDPLSSPVLEVTHTAGRMTTQV